MLTDTSDHAEVYAKFAGMAGAIVERAPAELVESVRSELGTMLRDLKLTGDAAD
jgi:predicted DNA-binding transcriptional regulator YafY